MELAKAANSPKETKRIALVPVGILLCDQRLHRKTLNEIVPYEAF